MQGLLQTFGTREGLERPFICSDVGNGRVLIADQVRDRLQVMTERGQFNTVPLQPPVSELFCAVVLDDHLYVASQRGLV